MASKHIEINMKLWGWPKYTCRGQCTFDTSTICKLYSYKDLGCIL